MGDINTDIMSDIIVFMKYARYDNRLKRRETWEEIVDRNKKMHVKKFPQLKDEIEWAYKFVYDKKVLPSMRSLQFSVKPIELNNFRSYNCSYLPINSVDAFKELMFLLLSGCGVGYSVQKKDVNKLPEVIKPKKTRRYLIADSIEGWADAVGILMESYFGERKTLPNFDFSDIRPKGEPLKTSGGRAPGAGPLKTCLHHIQTILDRKNNGDKITTLEAHDICCFLSDAVLSGGVRRSSLIALFSFDDVDMRTCKCNHWYETNPQRARANNSAVIVRHKITEEEFFKYFDIVKNSRTGEPGIFLTNNETHGTNPCGEVSLKPFQLCNLTTVNTVGIKTQDEFNERAKAASFIGTLQASYTNFHFVRDIWKETTEKDALIGVSLAGIASGDVFDFNIKEAAKIVVKENERVAELIGINKSSRCTTQKPDGTVSLVLGCSSGIHPWHSNYYIRRIRVNKEESIYKYLKKYHSELLEDDYFQPENQSIVCVPMKAPEGAITRGETELQFLNRVSKIFNDWIKPGYRKGDNHNNVSATVNVKENSWDKVGRWMWDNKDKYNALSLLPYDDHTYIQPPFEEINEEKYNEMTSKLKNIDLREVKEDGDYTNLRDNLACSGSSCEII